MPAWMRETVGWLRFTSQSCRRPMASPSATNVTGSCERSSRVTTNVLWRSVIAYDRDVETELARGKEDDLDDVRDEQRVHERSGDDVRREPELQQLVPVDE